MLSTLQPFVEEMVHKLAYLGCNVVSNKEGYPILKMSHRNCQFSRHIFVGEYGGTLKLYFH